MEINWYERVKRLKRMAAELEQWALRAQGRQRLVLGRIADDLKQFAVDIDALLAEEYEEAQAIRTPRDIPDWLADTGEWEEEEDWPEEDDEPWMNVYYDE